MANACTGHDGTIPAATTPLAARTVAGVVAERPERLEILKTLGINHCCGAHLTLTEAAASAGVPLDRLLAALAAPAREQGLDAIPESCRVVVDVREDIARGGEPFARIMAAVKALGLDQALVLRAPFEPVPLYGVLGKQGFAHRTERRDAADWWITFYRRGSSATSGEGGPTTGPVASETETVTLDVRGLEPPHPMVRILERLDALTGGSELIVLHERRPLFLYPQLEERGYVHQTDEPEPGLIRIRIRRRVDSDGVPRAG